MNLESEQGTIVKLIINNHQKNSDKLTKISGRDLTTKCTCKRYKKRRIANCHIHVDKDFDNCSILKKYRSPKFAGCIKRTVITISDSEQQIIFHAIGYFTHQTAIIWVKL